MFQNNKKGKFEQSINSGYIIRGGYLNFDGLAFYNDILRFFLHEKIFIVGFLDTSFSIKATLINRYIQFF